jgi:subtilase family serine protease
VTLRGVVTATNRAGSTSVTTNDFDYDMAGLAFRASDSGFVRGNLQYDPAQLRAWYGLQPDQNGAGQTIVITDFGRDRGLRPTVDHFSAHYGLPQTCRGSQSQGCFRLVITSAGNPGGVNRSGESEADVEWAHAIAPQAKIVLVQFQHAQRLFDKLGWFGDEGRDSVVSESWCDPCRGFRGFARDVVYPAVALACGRPHVVCVQASGDHGSPGDKPSNSPYVLAVGGTTFAREDDGSTRAEIPWRPSGWGDTDVPLPRPVWQKRVTTGCAGGDFSVVGLSSCAKRAVPDVSATAASVPVFQPTKKHGPAWFVFSGTSLSTPLWAALVALTDQQLQQDGQRPVGIGELHQVLYRGYVSAGLDDIRPHGWDLRTGLGSPKPGIVPALASAIERYRAGG